MANAAGWQPDPDDADQERYWSGAEWTDQVRPDVSARSLGATGAPDHSPQLHRALSAALSDLGAMEDRISTLFDRDDDDDAPTRSDGATATGAAATREATGRDVVAATRVATATETAAVGDTTDNDDDDDIIELFGEGDVGATEDDADVSGDGVVVGDRMAIISQYEEDIEGTFSDLDAELAAEYADETEKAKRRGFGRRAKRTTSDAG